MNENSDSSGMILLQWIENNLKQFSHLNGKTSEEYLMLLKPIGELALCCDIMIRQEFKVTQARRILNWAWGELDYGNFLRTVLLARPSMVMISSLYATFHKNGLYNDFLCSLIKHHALSCFSQSIQYPYWRRLDLELAFYELGVVSEFRPKFDQTWSFHTPEPWMIDNDAAYALTHEVFYITNFGSYPKLFEQKTLNYIRRWLPVWRRIFLKDDNFDIYAELLMTSLCIGGDKFIHDDFQPLLSEIHEYGYLRGPENSGRNLLEGVTLPARREFIRNYHTTLVGLMACTLNRCTLKLR